MRDKLYNVRAMRKFFKRNFKSDFHFMKKVFSTLFVLTFTAGISMAQENKFVVSAGPSLLIPTYSEINSVGFGFGVGIDYRLNNKFSLASDIDVDVFDSKVKNLFTDEITDGFILMPVMIGVKWRPVNNLYFAGKVGAVAGLKNASTNFALSPGLGYLVNINGKPTLDVGLNLLGVPGMASIPENTFLDKGGYSFLSLKLAYRF